MRVFRGYVVVFWDKSIFQNKKRPCDVQGLLRCCFDVDNPIRNCIDTYLEARGKCNTCLQLMSAKELFQGDFVAGGCVLDGVAKRVDLVAQAVTFRPVLCFAC